MQEQWGWLCVGRGWAERGICPQAYARVKGSGGTHSLVGQQWLTFGSGGGAMNSFHSRLCYRALAWLWGSHRSLAGVGLGGWVPRHGCPLVPWALVWGCGE